MTRAARLAALPIVLVALLAAACGRSGSSARSGVGSPTGGITVFAAASLTDAFTALGDAFTTKNPEAKVTFTFDASSALVTQIIQGAPADLFASADTANMDKLTAAGENGATPVNVATNRLQIIVGAGNPKGITGLADLAEPDVKLVVCDPSVPCGRYAATALGKASVTATPVSLEQNVKGVVTKVTAGEADAGIVYATDVKAVGAKAAGVDIPTDQNVQAVYPIARTKAAKNADLADAFIAFVTSADGQAILATYGFGTP